MLKDPGRGKRFSGLCFASFRRGVQLTSEASAQILAGESWRSPHHMRSKLQHLLGTLGDSVTAVYHGSSSLGGTWVVGWCLDARSLDEVMSSS